MATRWSALSDLWMYSPSYVPEMVLDDPEGDEQTAAGPDAPLPAATQREPDERDAILAGSEIFAGLTEEQRSEVAALGRIEEVRADEILGLHGNHGDTLYLIGDGQLQLMTPSTVGHLTVRIASAGECWPLACLVGDGTLITSAVAVSDLRLLALPRQPLLELMERRCDIGMPLFRAIAETFGDRYRSMLRRVTETADKAFLLGEAWANV